MASGPASRRADSPESPAKTGDASENIRKIVLASLERRRRTRSELETILRRKGFGSPAFGPILDRLTEVGLIDDLQYARVFLERRAASKPRGARLLRSELLAKGIPGDVADQALAERKAESDPVDDALKALKLWLPRQAKLEPRERRQKLWQFLARRGFSADVIEQAARRAESCGDSAREDGGEDGE